jgi:hypothetical protein
MSRASEPICDESLALHVEMPRVGLCLFAKYSEVLYG